MGLEELQTGFSKFTAIAAKAVGTNPGVLNPDAPGGYEAETQTTAAEDGVAALPVIVISHCWEMPSKPDPKCKTLSQVGQRLSRDLSKYQAWGFTDVGVFFE